MAPFNPDYFKVAGGTTHGGSFGPGKGNGAQQFATMRAELKHALPRRDIPRDIPRAGTSSKRRRAAARTEPAKKRSESALHVDLIHESRPQPGKKRRSSRKRHEQAMRPVHAATVGAGASTAGFGASTDVAPASVTRLRDRRRPPEAGAPSTLPPMLQGLLRNSWDLAREAAQLAMGIAAMPFNVARVLIRLRSTGVPD